MNKWIAPCLFSLLSATHVAQAADLNFKENIHVVPSMASLATVDTQGNVYKSDWDENALRELRDAQKALVQAVARLDQAQKDVQQKSGQVTDRQLDQLSKRVDALNDKLSGLGRAGTQRDDFERASRDTDRRLDQLSRSIDSLNDKVADLGRKVK